MAISLVNASSTGVSPAGASITLTVPAGVQNGDLLIAALTFAGGSNATVTGPTGNTWTLHKEQVRTTSVKAHIWYRVASGETAGSTTYTWSVSPNELVSGGIVAYRGVDTGSPFDVTPVGAVGSSQSVDSATGGVTTVTDGAWAIFGVHINSATAVTTPPTDYTEEFENNTGIISAIDDKEISPAGSTGTISAAMSGGSNKPWASILTAIKPATAAGAAGTLSATQAANTASAAGVVTIAASATPSQAANTLTGVGGVPLTGTASPSQAANTISAAGAIALTGSASLTQAAGTLSASGTVGTATTTGTLSSTQAAQTLSGTGSVAIASTAGVTQAANTISAAGGLAITGAATPTQAGDTLAAGGTVNITALFGGTQAAQTLTASGTNGANPDPTIRAPTLAPLASSGSTTGALSAAGTTAALAANGTTAATLGSTGRTTAPLTG